jgi:hypothetical protein
MLHHQLRFIVSSQYRGVRFDASVCFDVEVCGIQKRKRFCNGHLKGAMFDVTVTYLLSACVLTLRAQTLTMSTH